MGKYDDMLNLPHPISKNHPRMSLFERSAQFAPFSALTGYEESLEDAGKEYDNKIVLGSDKIIEIASTIELINKNIKEHPLVEIIYFQKEKNNKGKYQLTIDQVKRIDSLNRKIILLKTQIPLDDIYEIKISKKEKASE